MKLSLTKILLVTTVIILSVTIGNISTIIRVHFEKTDTLTLKPSNGATLKPTKLDIGPLIRDSFGDLLWFIQISDIHISIFRDEERFTDLEDFCQSTVDAIRPLVVLASGDLTDAKNVDTLGSQQYEEEWKLYRNALDKYNISKKTVWLDVRGNHDNFNVHGPTAKENYYRNYSMQGAANPRSYIHTVHTPSGKAVSFIAMDACLEPGPKRPFNFFGLVNQRETDHLRELIRKSRELGSSHSVWFGHYPTSCILSAGQGVRSLIGSDPGAQAYLCGHLHTMGGLLPHMYTLQHAGYLELELADWKDSRVYRVGAIDHGLFSFTDALHKQWPVALITNPKHALFHIPHREPEHSMLTSTHIRVLAFSTSDIVYVHVKIDQGDWIQCTHVQGPLYVTPWDPEFYAKGLHTIKVEVLDAAGGSCSREQPFALDGTRLDYQITPRILLMTNVATIFQVMFGLSIVGCVVPLSLLRLLMARVRGGNKCVPTTSFSFIRSWYRKLWILSNLDCFYYPLILYPLYITIGPWAVGEVIEDHIGVIFAWGTFINGAYLPGSFTYGYGFFQMCTYQFPLTLILAYKLDKRLYTPVPESSPCNKLCSILKHWFADLPLYIISFLQLLFLYFFWLSYGSLAILLGPFRSWPLFTTVYLWRRVHRTPFSKIQELADFFQEANFSSPRIKSSHSI